MSRRDATLEFGEEDFEGEAAKEWVEGSVQRQRANEELRGILVSGRAKFTGHRGHHGHPFWTPSPFLAPSIFMNE
jgi:hypothetical protein